MSLFSLSPFKIAIPTAIGLVTIGSLALTNAANAFSLNSGSDLSNPGFESFDSGTGNPINWSITGDVTTIDSTVVKALDNQTTENSEGFISPVGGSRQAIITNAYNINDGRVDDTEALAENEMGPATPLEFNISGTNPIDADTLEPTNADLQTFLGLNTNALSISRDPEVLVGEEPNTTPDVRTSKEGSGLYQEFTVTIDSTDVQNGTNGFEVSFNWAYLTNDGQVDGFGNQDYSFFTLYDTNAATDPSIEVLGDSSNPNITDPSASNTYNNSDLTFYQSGNVFTTQVTGLLADTYTYRLGFGVVDVDGSGRSSALVLDELGIRQVPFEFTPATGIALVMGFIGIGKLRSKFKN